MPLVFAKAGDTVTITRISGKDEIRQHLADLGFVVAAKVLIISQMGGNLIVQVKGSRVALDRSMAGRIFFSRGVFLTIRRSHRITYPLSKRKDE